MKDVKEKQISFVVITPKGYDVLEFISCFEKFIEQFKGVEITGTHVKVLNKNI